MKRGTEERTTVAEAFVEGMAWRCGSHTTTRAAQRSRRAGGHGAEGDAREPAGTSIPVLADRESVDGHGPEQTV